MTPSVRSKNHTGWWLAIETSNPSVMSSAGSPSAPASPNHPAPTQLGQVAVAKLAPHSDPVPSPQSPPALHSPLTIESIIQQHDPLGRPLDDLPGAVGRALSRAAITLSDLQGVAVSVGPGGFTSVRSACCYAALLAEGITARRPHNPCLVASVPTPASCALTLLDALTSLKSQGPIVIALASKGPQAWCCPLPSLDLPSLLANHCAWASHGRMMSSGELTAINPALLITDHHTPASFTQSFRTMPIALSALGVLRAALACTHTNARALQPLYPREPEAVTLWNQRHAQQA